MSARLSWSLRWRLSVLWILEWGITGALLTYLPLYFQENGLSPNQQAQLMAVSAIGLWIAPFVVGQVCDRWLASEQYLAIAHFVGGLTLVSIPIATEMYKETGEHFGVLMAMVGLYAVAYFPTMPLASALTFRHLSDPDAQFGGVRIWGTVGWMLAGMTLSLWLGREQAFEWLLARYPDWSPTIAEIQAGLVWLPPPSSSDCFSIAAILSFALSSFCVFLPATPPIRRPRRIRSMRDAIAPLQVLAMFRDPTFSLLIGISFLLSLVVPLYTLQAPNLLRQFGFSSDWIPAVMLIGQISEFPALLLLPFCLKRFGLKTTFAMGMAAWFVRYVLFAIEGPLPSILFGLALHGICHVFLVIVIQLYVDSQCRRDLRTSAQNLFAFITMGIGMPLGALLGGELAQVCFDEETRQVDYQILFSIPAAVIFVLLVVYLRWFRVAPPDSALTAQSGPPPEADRDAFACDPDSL
jgi:MFS family permease